MKKKVLAFLLASTMVVEPFSVTSAADFSDGTGQDVVQFSDDGEDAPEVKNDDIDQFSTDAVGERKNSSKPSEDAIQMGDDVWFTFNESTGTATISGTGDMWDYYDNGYDYTNKHQNPFAGKSNVQKIVISEGITNVGDYFLQGYEYRGNIKEISLSSTITKIGRYAFQNCFNVKSVNLPGGLETIEDYSFDNCSGLIEINVPDSVKSIGKSCFQSCRKLSTAILPDALIEIPEFAFSGCRSLTEIILPSKLETIGQYAFSGCSSLKEITIPASIKNIKWNIFGNCTNLTEVTFEKGYAENISENMFENCTALTDISIPEEVSSIYSDAFCDCSRLSTVTINGSKTRINSDSFRNCKNLRLIKGYNCSYTKKYYDSLTDTQKNSIKFDSLGEGQHEWSAEKVQTKEPTCTEKGIKAYRCEICGKTKDEEELPAYDHNWNNGVITKQATETEEGEIKYKCWRCGETKTEKIPKLSAIKFDDVNFGWDLYLYDKANINGRANKAISYYITTVDKNSSAPEYDETHDTQGSSQDGYFEINITMPDEEVDVYIFAADTEGNHTYYKVTPNYNNRPQKPSNTVKVGDNITATVEGDTITFVGSGEIYNTSEENYGNIWIQAGINTHSIKHIVFKEEGGSIINLGECLLSGFMAVEDIELPKGLKKIGEGVFQYCEKLQKIDIPPSVEEIGEYAWTGSGIETINWPEKVISIPARVFSDTNLKEFSVPEGVAEINDYAFDNCTKLTKISIPKSVTYIGSDVFEYCRNLTIYGYKDSTAESYAKANNIKFVSADYKVVFKDNGRTQKTEYVTSGQNATPPTLSSKPGYTLSWDADYTNVTEDMVINAVWTKKDSSNGGGNTTIIVSPSETNKYTVTFKDRGKIVKTEKVKSGDAAEYPYISRNGYELSWDKDFSKVTTDITVNAVWTVIKPNKVTSLTAEVQKNSIDLSWDRAENTDYYLVYRKATSDTEYKQIKKTTRILWADENVEPGTEYSYKVVGVCSVDGKKYQGADSDIVTAKIGTPQIGDVYSVGDLKYKVTGAKEVSVIGLAKVTDTLTIPSSVTISGKVYKVTSVQAKAFYQNENIVSIAIGNNVTYVGKYAFYQCPNLETVKFGKRVSVISTCAFTQCPNLENVTLPSSIRRIGAKAFYQCMSVKVLKINGSALEYVGKKGLAVNKTVTLRLPKKVYTRYKELIKTSNIYSKTKFIKF